MKNARFAAALALAALAAFGLWWLAGSGRNSAQDVQGTRPQVAPDVAPDQLPLAEIDPGSERTTPRDTPEANLASMNDPVDAIESDPIAPGSARLIVKISGGPTESMETTGGHRRFNLTARLKNSEDRIPSLEIDLEGPEVIAHWDIPSEVPLQFGLVALGVWHTCSGAPIILGDGTTQELAVDLGHGSARYATVTEIPCDAVGGLKIDSAGSWATILLPDGRSEPFPVKASSLSNDEGRAVILDPKGADAKYSLGLKSRTFDAELVAGQAENAKAIRPSVPIVTLRSAPGSRLYVEKLTVGSLRRYTRNRSSESNVVLLPASLPEPQRVFLDEAPIGVIGKDAWAATGSLCLDVDDIAWSVDLASVEFTVSGVQGQSAMLDVYRFDDRSLAAAKSEPPMSSFDVAMLTSGSQGKVGTITSPKSSMSAVKSLGRWTLTSPDIRTAKINLKPGRYYACLRLIPIYRQIVRLAPFTVEASGTQAIVLDAQQTTTWAIVAVDDSGERARGLSMPGDLWLRNIKLQPKRRVHGRWPYEAAAGTETEPSYDVETFGTMPKKVRLSRTPGVNGALVSLRDLRTINGAGASLLAAVVPVATRLYLPIKSVTPGRLGGMIDGDHAVDDISRMFSSEIEVVPESITYDDEKEQICIVLRGPAITGVLTERESNNDHVRDWFSASADGVELAGGGLGHFIEVNSELPRDVKLKLFPKPHSTVNGRPAYHGIVKGNDVRRLWIPDSAAALEWWDGETKLGRTENLSQNTLTIP